MSECVVRMEMPQHCGECNLYVDGWCYALTPDSPQEKEWYASHKERPPMCPVICQLPEGHGRLIDADALKQSSIRKPRLVTSYDYGAMATVFMDVINDATTIVPERSKNK